MLTFSVASLVEPSSSTNVSLNSSGNWSAPPVWFAPVCGALPVSV